MSLLFYVKFLCHYLLNSGKFLSEECLYIVKAYETVSEQVNQNLEEFDYKTITNQMAIGRSLVE